MNKQSLITVASKAIAPTQSVERIQTVDILRGFALLGILLVNMELFANPVQLVVMPIESASVIDSAAAWLVRFLVEGKFFSLFSFLFGLGFALQLKRAEDKGARFAPLSARPPTGVAAASQAAGPQRHEWR